MNRQLGLSLIELMVAMALSLILMAGVIQIFISNKQAFDITQDLSEMQENGRVGLSFISESLRMADHWGGVDASDVGFGTTALTTAPGSCNAAWIFDTDETVRGYEGAANPSSVTGLPSNCIAATDYVPNTDILVVRYADGRDLLSNAEIAADTNSNFARVSVGQNVSIFSGANAAGAIAAIPDDDGVYNMPYRTEMYFVRPCSIKNSAGNCVDSIPTLVRLTLEGDAFSQQALVEGVEQLQLDYGVDTDGDLGVDQYDTASAVADWDEVISARISLVARASSQDFSIDQEGEEILLVGDMASTGSGYTVAAADRHFRRKLYEREIHIRNRSRL